VVRGIERLCLLSTSLHSDADIGVLSDMWNRLTLRHAA
jgi:hypothetical protein